MIVDERATDDARQRHAFGVQELTELFQPGAPRVVATLVRAERFGSAAGTGRPVRLRPGVPPVRDAWHARRHKLRKISCASRRRNRNA